MRLPHAPSCRPIGAGGAGESPPSRIQKIRKLGSIIPIQRVIRRTSRKRRTRRIPSVQPQLHTAILRPYKRVKVTVGALAPLDQPLVDFISMRGSLSAHLLTKFFQWPGVLGVMSSHAATNG